MRVYLSGPITGVKPHIAEYKFAASATEVTETGSEPVNPFMITDPCENPGECSSDATQMHSWECWMKACIALMMTCDAIYMLPGWENSKGARLEQFVALNCGMDIY